MEKSADAFRTIGEMADELGVRTHILRYWEEQFPMLKPLKRAGGRRLYRPDDVVLVQTIHRLLHNEGYTIKGARNYLSKTVTGGREIASSSPVQESPAQAAQLFVLPDVSALRAVRDRLEAALAAA
ncbi:MAG: MerR family transcriptional regulator [Sphingorhabdus sp.]